MGNNIEKFELEEVDNELINVKKSIDGLQEKEKVLIDTEANQAT
jgi:hypothetical protein